MVGVLEILPVVDQLIFCQRVSVSRVNSEDLAVFEVNVEVGFSLAVQVKQVVGLVHLGVLGSFLLYPSVIELVPNWRWLQADLS